MHRGFPVLFGFLLVGVAIAPSPASADFAIGDTLTLIQRPLPNIPALVVVGDTLRISCDAPPGTSGWTAALVYRGTHVELDLLAAAYSPVTEWWEIDTRIPEVPFYELYDLRVEADGVPADDCRRAVGVLPEFKEEYYFIHITDPHLPTHLYYYQSGADTDTSEMVDLRAVIDDVNIIHPEFVLLTGDLVNEGELEDFLGRRYYSRAQRILNEFEVPVFLTSGNHDLGGWDDTPPPAGTARRDWWRFFGWKRLFDPPVGTPWFTQNYSFDYGPVHYIGLEGYLNYDGWRYNIYGYESFTEGQMIWLENDLAAAAGQPTRVLFYHYDFSDQIHLASMDIDMALSGHIHRDEGNLQSPPYDLITNCVCDGERAYRLIRVSDGELTPRPTLSAGHLEVVYEPANDGTHEVVTATIENQQSERFEYGQLRIWMPDREGTLRVTGGELQQTAAIDSKILCYVGVDIAANNVQTVTVTLDSASVPGENPEVSALRLDPGRPRPLGPGILLTYQLPRAGVVSLVIHDARGRLIARLEEGWRDAGTHEAHWDERGPAGRRAAAGVYLARLKTADAVRVRRVVLAR